MSNFTGTAHFESIQAVRKYYGGDHGETALNEGRAFVGKPSVDSDKGEKLMIHKEERRYFIETPDPSKHLTAS